MKKKTVLFSVGLFGTLLGGGTTVLAADAADTMPDISNKQISVGYYHNWEAERVAGYRGGKPANLALDKINPFYNVISVAFMKGEGIPTFKPYNVSDQEFRQKVASLNNEGRAVLMSLGGADSHIELHKGEEQAFANEIIRLVERYGFDGLDIDLEQTAVAAGDNQSVIPAALKIVREHYQKENKHFIISMAPEFPYLRNNQAYTPYVRALENEYDFIAPQLYNQAGDGISIGTEWIAQNNDSRKYDFLYGISKSFNEGSGGFIQIPANKLAIGIPANEDAAANGFVKDPTTVYQVFEQMEKENTPLKGVMTWSANWDEGMNSAGVAYNESFAKSYQNLFGEKIPDTEEPSKPTNLKVTATHSSVSMNWTPSKDNVRVSHYNIYQNNQLIGTSNAASYTVVNLTPETQYSFSIEAVDTAGNHSLRSDILTITTSKETAQKPSVPRGLTVNNVTQDSVTISWAANDASEKVTQYEIYREGVRIAVTGTTTFTDTGLMSAKSYVYQVKAINAVGTSEASQSVTATTLGESPQGDTWTSGKAYGVGEIVTYKGGTYRCLQAHTAIPSWAPDITTSLWQKIR
ncbi:chitinase [Enterococcus durans]|uniref:fibronectin type III domain-containing protein n=1 Tax=Enterococcus durans TaxID=53345 RepID=UPI0011BDB06A|nr:glycosyl hydrolase family 18 protein [Enterococcus durans]QED59565.1 chitinase [Enterococcus durans]QED61998.1 chitinase [Enterococcus durans]